MMFSRRRVNHVLSALATATMMAAPVRGILAQALPVPQRLVAVDDSAGLALALDAANPGDHIVLADGTYDGAFTLARHGTAEQPIVVRPVNPHAAHLTGFFNLDGDHGWVQQLLFQPARLQVTGSDTKVLRNVFRDSTGGLDVICIRGNSKRAEVAYNEVRDFGDLDVAHQRGISVRVTARDLPHSMHIHHNYVLNQRGEGGAIGIGIAKSNNDYSARARVEWNLIEDVNRSAVYFKSADNVARFNTVRQIYTARASGFQSRHGLRNDFIANASINAGGVWLRGKQHRAIGNYKDDARLDLNDLHGAPRGTLYAEHFKKSEGTQWPAGENCLFIGNIGGLAIGSGYRRHAVKALNNTIEAHTGPVTMVAEQHAGTVDRSREPPSLVVPAFVVLQPRDVGPFA